MKTLQKIILAVAAATLLVLLWKIDLAQVMHHLSQVGWGITLILAQEIVAHCFNATGWRFAFPKHAASSFPFSELIKLRAAGDAVNYLTPSATIAGEFIRAARLNDSHHPEIRYASVAVAKFTQMIAQACFILMGLIFALQHVALQGSSYESLLRTCAVILSCLLLALLLYGAWVWRRIPLAAGVTAPPTNTEEPEQLPSGTDPPHWRAALVAVPGQCRDFFKQHPGRFAASVAFFMMGYAWGAFEAYWICFFLGTPVSVGTAFTIEVLSSFLDGILFMVPAKVGTQEVGKTAIFAALGLKPALGFAFGVVRHLRELSWSGLGLFLCASNKAPVSQLTAPTIKVPEPLEPPAR